MRAPYVRVGGRERNAAAGEGIKTGVKQWHADDADERQDQDGSDRDQSSVLILFILSLIRVIRVPLLHSRHITCNCGSGTTKRPPPSANLRCFVVIGPA